MSDVKPHFADFTTTPMPGDWSAYEARIARVTAYIHAHMDEPLDLDRLAEVACLSRFHWHRIYRAIQGETAAQTLKRVRMTRAGFDLAEGTLSLATIARRCGYPNQRSFSRAFADIYGVSPSAYRDAGGHSRYRKPERMVTDAMYPVEIRDLPERSLVGLLHKGSYRKIGESFERLVSLGGIRGLMPHVRGMVGVYYDDPMATPEADLRSHAAFIVEDSSIASSPLEPEKLASGSYAVLTLKGPHSDLPAAYDWMYSVWLRDNNKTVRAVPPYENYLNNPREVSANDLLTEICVPVAA